MSMIGIRSYFEDVNEGSYVDDNIDNDVDN
jgi:hypothetical protein